MLGDEVWGAVGVQVHPKVQCSVRLRSRLCSGHTTSSSTGELSCWNMIGPLLFQ